MSDQNNVNEKIKFGFQNHTETIVLPGVRDIGDSIIAFNCIVTPLQTNGDLGIPLMYNHNTGVYENAKRLISELIDDEYRAAMQITIDKCNSVPIGTWDDSKDRDKVRTRAAQNIKNGVSGTFLKDLLDYIARRTATHNLTVNPASHIPFWNGNLNLKTWRLEQHTSELIFTYQIHADFYDDNAPLPPEYMQATFRYLTDLYKPTDIPKILEYLAYCLYSRTPVDKTLWIFGPPRIGKGVIPRLIESLIPDRYAAIELTKLLLQERFQYTGITDKNVLVDTEIQRKYRRGITPNWRNFLQLFGSDTYQLEAKFKEGTNQRGSYKGIFIGNLPALYIAEPAALSRISLVVTKDKRATADIREIHLLMLEERNVIVTVLMHYLRGLIHRDFKMLGQTDTESLAQEFDRLSNPVTNFIEDETTFLPGVEPTPVDKAYRKLLAWLTAKGIPPVAQRTFTLNFQKTYKKERRRIGGKPTWVFADVVFYDELKAEEQEIQTNLEQN